MATYAEDNYNIREYLLGNLSEEVRQRVEERLLVDDDFFEELLISEEELIDDYVYENLSDDDRLKFEQHFLSTTERRRKLTFALALNRHASDTSAKVADETTRAPAAEAKSKPSWVERLRAFWSSQRLGLQAALALTVVVGVASAVWLFIARTPSSQTFFPLTLTISTNTRGDGAQAGKVKLPLGADALKISLMIPESGSSAARYRVELLTGSRGTQTLEVAEQDARSVSVKIPATQLARGQYILQLYAIDATGTERRIPGSYYFDVE